MQVAQPPELKDAVGPKRLAGKVTTILQRIEKELDAVDLHIGDSMHILDADNDGMVRLHTPFQMHLPALLTQLQQHPEIPSPSQDQYIFAFFGR